MAGTVSAVVPDVAIDVAAEPEVIPGPALVELRVFDGANPYFPRPAVRLTLDIGRLLVLGDTDARALGAALDMTACGPGARGTALRRGFALRVAATVVRRVAEDSGTNRLPVRTRTTAAPHRVVVSYPWRHRHRAEALGPAVAGVLDALPAADPMALLRAAVAAMPS